MSKPRIKADMTLQGAIVALSDGNAGALTVCTAIIRHTADPDKGLDVILALDSLGVYGPAIWQLHKDVCGENLECTIKLVRAAQLGFVSKEVLHRAIANYGKGLDLETAIAAVS